MHSRASRVARGGIAGAVATGAAAASHGLADGAAPSSLALVTGFLFAGILGTFVIGRTPSLPRLVVVVAGSQLAFHLVFSWLTPGTATSAGHHEVATLLGPTVAQQAVAHHGTDPWMWAAHTVALIATVAFLRRAELALWNLLRDALRVTVVPTVAIAARPTTKTVVPADSPRHPISFVFFSVLSHRGPPATRFAL